MSRHLGGGDLLRSRRPFCRGRAAFVAGIVLVGLNNAAQATIGSIGSELATSFTLPLAEFPPDSETQGAPSRPVVLAQAAPAAGKTTPPAAAANPGGMGNAAQGQAGNPNALPPLGSALDTPYGQTPNVPGGGLDTGAPAWEIDGRANLTEIGTDNVGLGVSSHQADLISEFSAGVTVTTDTPRLLGVFSYTGTYRQALSSKGQNRFMQYGILNEHATLVPDYFTIDFLGNASEVDRLGLGVVNNSLRPNAGATQIYSLGVSPDLKAQTGRLGFVDLNYYYDQLWTDRNTGPIVSPLGSVGALTGAKRQLARASFQMPGTLDARLQTTVSVDGSEMTTGSGLGTFRRASAQLGNEYQLVRSFSLIAQGGYETLSDSQIAKLNGHGVIWAFGGHWQPNIDSSIFLTYGRHEFNNDIAAQWQWAVTPITEFTGTYSDNVTNPLASLAGGGFGGGYITNPIVSTPGGPITLPGTFYIPGIQSQQNNIFRQKLLNADLDTTLDGHDFRLSVFHTDRHSFTNIGPRDDSNTGIYLYETEPAGQDIFVTTRLGYVRSSTGHANTYNVGLTASYRLTPTLDGSLGYDFIRRDIAVRGSAFTSNSITLRLRKAI